MPNTSSKITYSGLYIETGLKTYIKFTNLSRIKS